MMQAIVLETATSHSNFSNYPFPNPSQVEFWCGLTPVAFVGLICMS
jgi:hypothetical protein